MIHKPDSMDKMTKQLRNLAPIFSDRFRNKMVSSTYCKMVVLSFKLLRHIPFSQWLSSNWSTNVGKDSTIKFKSKGNNGHPCRNPLFYLNSPPTYLLTSTETLAYDTHLLIDLIHLSLRSLNRHNHTVSQNQS